MQQHPLMFLLDLPSGTLTAAFPVRGKGSLDITNNFLSKQEIGYYEAELPSGAYERLRKLYAAIDFSDLPEVLELPPDTKTLSVGEMVGEDFDLKSYRLDAVAPKVEPLLDEMRKATEFLRMNPLRALRGEGATTQHDFPIEKPVSFQVTLQNVGTERIETDSPFVVRGVNGESNLRLIVTRDNPPEQLRESETLWLELGVENVHPPEGEKVPAERRVSLQPGETLRFVVRKKLLSTPGRYRAVLTYFTSRGNRGLEVMEGFLTMDLGTFEVK
jgi:hypothetical protein